MGDRQFDLLPLAARTPAPQSGEYVNNTGSDITGLWQTRSLTHCFVEALAPVDAQSQPDRSDLTICVAILGSGFSEQPAAFLEISSACSLP